MEKEAQRQTLHNVYHELNKINILGSSAEQLLGIKQAVSAVHDAIAKEIKEESEDDAIEANPVNGVVNIEAVPQ